MPDEQPDPEDPSYEKCKEVYPASMLPIIVDGVKT